MSLCVKQRDVPLAGLRLGPPKEARTFTPPLFFLTIGGVCGSSIFMCLEREIAGGKEKTANDFLASHSSNSSQVWGQPEGPGDRRAMLQYVYV